MARGGGVGGRNSSNKASSSSSAVHSESVAFKPDSLSKSERDTLLVNAGAGLD
jgi:hypothetical protein